METKEGWFTENIKDPGSLPIACFSAEYGLHHCLPFYAGGLGFLAGDRLKECNDLAVPLVAVGFMYPEGYLRQRIHEDGWQENLDEVLDRDAAPITRVLSDEGEQSWVKIMKEAMKGTGPRFCSRRMVKEYATKFYQNALRSAMM
jgi:starch phosphorylase